MSCPGSVASSDNSARMSSCLYTALTLGVVLACSLATLLSVHLTTTHTNHSQVTPNCTALCWQLY